MRLGMHMRELWRSKIGLGIALFIALLAATRILFAVSLFPPGLERRSMDVATASIQVLVDTPRSTMIDLRQDVYELRSLSQRSVILGNVLASAQVRDYIGRRLGVPAEEIEVTPPLTPDQPRVVAGSEAEPHTSDILRRPDEYRLSIRANPAVPVLDVYSQAPDAEAAKALANSAVSGLEDYLNEVASERGTPVKSQVELERLGSARGGVINPGAGVTMALVVFALVFALCSAAVLFVGRVRRGWANSARFSGRLPAA
jgi:hypothetical protein